MKWKELLEAQLAYSRAKHPWCSDGKEDGQEVHSKHSALRAVKMELEELEFAVAHEEQERQKEEALHLAVTALRFALGDHLQNRTQRGIE